MTDERQNDDGEENDTDESESEVTSARIEFEEELDPFEDEEQLREHLSELVDDEELIEETIEDLRDAEIEVAQAHRRLRDGGVTVELRTANDTTIRADTWGAADVDLERETLGEAGLAEETSEDPDESPAEGEYVSEFDDPDATEEVEELVEEDERPRHRRR